MNPNLFKWLMGAMLLCSVSAHAAVSLSGTRLIFDGTYREVSIEAVNRSPYEVLLQAWLSDPAGEGDHSGELPLVLTPHLSQLPAQGKQVLRILYEGVGMPLEQESLLHLYVMEIPRRTQGENQLSIAIRQRINVFYRPPELLGDPADTAQALRWQLARDSTGATSLQINNPTAYHASLQRLRLEDGAGQQEVSDYLLLPPGASQNLPFKQPLADDARLSFIALTDYGGQRHYRAEVNRRAPSNAQWLADSAPIKEVQP
jgi:P pilus assembly chaperone PapD